MKASLIILLLLPFAISANYIPSNGDDIKVDQNDSIHSSLVLSVEYKFDTLYVKSRHYTNCCDRLVVYNDLVSKRNYSVINIVQDNIGEECLCTSERVVFHKIFIKDLREAKFMINGVLPSMGIMNYVNPAAPPVPEKKWWQRRRRNETT